MIRARPRRRGEAGFSLIETVVTMSIMGVVILAVFGAFDYLQSRSAINVSRQQGIEQSAVAMQVISEDLRATYVYPTLASGLDPSSSATTALFYSNIGTQTNVNGCPELISLSVTPAAGNPADQQLVETQTNPSQADTNTSPPCDWPGTPTRSRVLADYVQTATPLFQYYAIQNLTGLGSYQSCPASPSTDSSVDVVAVNLVLASGPQTGAPTTTVSQVIPLVPYVTALQQAEANGSSTDQGDTCA